MNKTYADFLKETIYSKELDKHAVFEEVPGKTDFLNIICGTDVIDFPMHFDPDYYDALLVAAVQTLEVYYEFIKEEDKIMYNYIDDTVKIDFPVSKDIKNLMNLCEKADLEDDYGKYNNYVEYFLYTLCKEAYVQGHLTKKQWETMERRYLL